MNRRERIHYVWQTNQVVFPQCWSNPTGPTTSQKLSQIFTDHERWEISSETCDSCDSCDFFDCTEMCKKLTSSIEDAVYQKIIEDEVD